MEGESQKPWGVLRSLTKGVASIPLYGNEVIIGKNVIGTTNKNISRVHFKLIKKDDKVYYIQDCSTNGTFINNSRLKKNVPTRIRDGVDVVVLNHVRPDSIRFMFSVEDDEDSSNPKYIEFCERYDYGEYLGEGSYAIVRLVTDKATGTQYAMKTINREKQGSVSKRAESVFDEVKVLSALSHPKIVNTKEAFIGFRNIYIVMDLYKKNFVLFSRTL